MSCELFSSLSIFNNTPERERERDDTFRSCWLMINELLYSLCAFLFPIFYFRGQGWGKPSSLLQRPSLKSKSAVFPSSRYIFCSSLAHGSSVCRIIRPYALQLRPLLSFFVHDSKERLTPDLSLKGCWVKGVYFRRNEMINHVGLLHSYTLAPTFISISLSLSYL